MVVVQCSSWPEMVGKSLTVVLGRAESAQQWSIMVGRCSPVLDLNSVKLDSSKNFLSMAVVGGRKVLEGGRRWVGRTHR